MKTNLDLKNFIQKNLQHIECPILTHTNFSKGQPMDISLIASNKQVEKNLMLANGVSQEN
jgi:hypothetical protein